MFGAAVLRGLAAAGHCGHDADFVAGAGGGVQTVEEAHVLAVQVDVYEVAQVAVFVQQAVLKPG